MTRLSPERRSLVRRRARARCEYCQSSSLLTGEEFTIDHIVPRSHGGINDLDNLCYCCFWCNCYKSATAVATDPRTGKSVSIFNPRQDRWLKHFRWSPSGTRIIGRTAVGRATVRGLRLNRPALVRSRKLWVGFGLHPPERPG